MMAFLHAQTGEGKQIEERGGGGKGELSIRPVEPLESSQGEVYFAFDRRSMGGQCPAPDDPFVPEMKTIVMPLENEFDYFLSRKEEFAEKYGGKFVVIKGQEVIGTYDNEIEAIRETQKSHKLGSFLVQKCGGPEEYTQTFHSRVAF